MIPIHELLSRIRHDPEFGRGQFEIGYFDRREGTVHRVALQAMVFPAGERRVFEVVDATGQVRRIPFHRVREVYREGRRIWNRLVPTRASFPCGGAAPGDSQADETPPVP